MNTEYRVGDKLTVEIEKIVPRGFGLAFAEGLTIFVPLAAVGDRLCVCIEELKQGTAFASIVEVERPSPERVDPPCEYFGACGGCDFQHLRYDAQLRAKEGIIRDCLHRIGKIEFDGPIKIIPSPSEFGYRMRTQWHLDVKNKKIGYYRTNSRDLIDIKACPIIGPQLRDTLDELRRSLDWKQFSGVVAKIDAAVGDEAEVSLFSVDFGEPAAEISLKAAGETYFFSARSFFQGNRFLLDKLVEIAVGDAHGNTAFDLYSGVGLFSLPLARRFQTVFAIEENEFAVKFAKKAARHSGIENVRFYKESVRRFLSGRFAEPPDFVLLDPPRAGTEKETVMNLIKLRPREISYVACEPSILARDLRRFTENGYRVDSVTAIDLFPQTHHIETVAKLSFA
ncbi:MAG TPA: class I SAM-dependent RNA methyltransferase [Blastocatellia bacterium]|nr:class I SAM-dependent RNA methyltransferase [Blastocatellia bacterium]